MTGTNTDRPVRRASTVEWEGCPPERWGDFCVVDGARDPEIYDIATRSREEWACLYDGQLPRAVVPVAPYLVRLRTDSHFTRLFYTKGWGQSWGIVLRSSVSLKEMRRHLRTLNYVWSNEHGKLLFRFYDPRVLRMLLPICNTEQLDAIFGPIEAILLENAEDTDVLTYRREGVTSLPFSQNSAAAGSQPAQREDGRTRGMRGRTMLVIKDAQIEALRMAKRELFEQQMCRHLHEFSPPLFDTLGEAGMLDVVRFGITRAESYGFTFRGPIRLYLEMMLLLGGHFDTDPQYPWVGLILGQKHVPQMQRAEWLYDELLVYRQRVAGKDDVFTFRALRALSSYARQPFHLQQDGLETALLEEMSTLYPEKARYVGVERLQALINAGVVRSSEHGFSGTREIVMIVILMFVFGHRCTTDPIYPWISRTLKMSRSKRAQRLESRAIIWLDHVLENYSEGEGP